MAVAALQTKTETFDSKGVKHTITYLHDTSASITPEELDELKYNQRVVSYSHRISFMPKEQEIVAVVI